NNNPDTYSDVWVEDGINVITVYADKGNGPEQVAQTTFYADCEPNGTKYKPSKLWLQDMPEGSTATITFSGENSGSSSWTFDHLSNITQGSDEPFLLLDGDILE